MPMMKGTSNVLNLSIASPLTPPKNNKNPDSMSETLMGLE